MTWLDIFRKAKQNDVFTDPELDLIEGAARAEVDSLFDRGKPKSVTTQGEHRNGNGNGSKAGYTRIVAVNETLIQSTPRANVLALRDWMTVASAEKNTGIESRVIIALVNKGLCDVIEIDGAPDLVHVRQIAYALEHGKRLDIDLTVFDGWKRQSDIARDLGVSAHDLSKLARAGKVAAFKPHARIMLMNEDEVMKVLSDA